MEEITHVKLFLLIDAYLPGPSCGRDHSCEVIPTHVKLFLLMDAYLPGASSGRDHSFKVIPAHRWLSSRIWTELTLD